MRGTGKHVDLYSALMQSERTGLHFLQRNLRENRKFMNKRNLDLQVRDQGHR
jgi:hypothetical protein